MIGKSKNYVVTIALQSGIGVHMNVKKLHCLKKMFCFHIHQLYFPLIKINSPRVNLKPGVFSKSSGPVCEIKSWVPCEHTTRESSTTLQLCTCVHVFNTHHHTQ